MTRGLMGLSRAFVMAGAMACSSQAEAFDVTNIVRTDSYVGLPLRRKVEVTGNYTLAAGESLRIVNFVANSGTAQGTYTENLKQWKAGVIDNGINIYKVEFHVWKGGIKTVYTTRLYSFGVK